MRPLQGFFGTASKDKRDLLVAVSNLPTVVGVRRILRFLDVTWILASLARFLPGMCSKRVVTEWVMWYANSLRYRR